MDFREFQYVVTIADCCSITDAAKQLYISQPSLSYALAKIEKEIGLKLFDRSKQPLVLTDAGQYYVTVARQFLRDKSNFQNHLADLKNGANGSISLGIPAERSGYMLPPVLPQFRRKFPGSSFYIQEASTTELFSLLRTYFIITTTQLCTYLGSEISSLISFKVLHNILSTEESSRNRYKRCIYCKNQAPNNHTTAHYMNLAHINCIYV